MTRASRGFRKRILLLATIALIVALCGAGQTGAIPRSPEEPMERMVLRLHDLPPGYFPLNFSEGSDFELICEPLDPAEPPRALASFIRHFLPEGCMGTYLRLYRVPGSAPSAQLVGTGALDAGSPKGAKAGFAVAPQILSLITEDESPKEVPTTALVGDATRLFHWPRAPSILGEGYRPGSFLVWRSGNVLATVLASAGSLEASDRIAEELARRQLAHIEQPTPYTRAERNASEVGLDDPALKLPVYWLGRNFAPGRGLPVARLESAGNPRYDREHLAGPKLELQYSHNLKLGAWTKSSWKRFVATRPVRKFLTEPCLESTKMSLSDRRATVYAGNVESFRPCAAHSPKWFFAIVHLGSEVITVNPNACLDRDCPVPPRSCLDCREPRVSFNSLAGMKAAVRALRLRPAPDYGAVEP